MLYSYVRVSTEKQDYLRQDVAIKKWCEENNATIDREFKDKLSGKSFNRKQYQEMRSIAKSGDTIVLKEIDRLGRDWDSIKEEWQYYTDNDINVLVLDMPLLSKSLYDKDGNVDLTIKLIKNIVLETICYTAQTEREKNSRRTKEALQAKKAQGMILGRPKDKEQEKQVKELYLEGKSKSDIAFLLNTSRAQIYKVIKRLQDAGELPKQ